ncbi:MAG TPA: sugar ABC transporter ATP-binding protein, partial [Lentzea sp.]
IDVGAKAEVQALIDELAREGLAVLLISSELDELLDGADRLVVLRDGSVAGELEGDQLTREHVLAAIASEVNDDVDSHSGTHVDSH